MGLLVAPNTWEARTIFERTNGIFPVPPSLVGVTLEHITTRETNDGRVELLQGFGKINAQSILATHVGGWEQGDQIEVEIAGRRALLRVSIGNCDLGQMQYVQQR